MLDRRLLRRLSAGEVVDPDWLRLSFPTWWHFDVLRALNDAPAGVVRKHLTRSG